jgi:hypothetical protein
MIYGDERVNSVNYCKLYCPLHDCQERIYGFVDLNLRSRHPLNFFFIAAIEKFQLLPFLFPAAFLMLWH